MERKLASIQKIAKLTPIDGADKIEVAHVLGWKVVVQKGLHKEGDLVVYFEIDSLLPELPEFEFLRKNCFVTEKTSVNGAGFRLKTIKLRGQISQGLIIPIRELTDYLVNDPGNPYTDTRPEKTFLLDEGDDVTEDLGVKKFERPIPANLAGRIRGNFPSFIPKTDQERIQNFFGDFWKKYKDHDWEVSLKLDGSSMTVYYYAPEDRFGVCSRNIDLVETEDNLFWQVARKLDLERILRSEAKIYNEIRDAEIEAGGKDPGMLHYIAWQGELMGPGIQGNREKLTEHQFYVFDMICNGSYYPSSGRRKTSFEFYDIPHVPVYEIAKMGYDSADGFLELAEFGYDNGESLNNPVREGLVFKSIQDPSVSFKAINNKYLLDGGE